MTQAHAHTQYHAHIYFDALSLGTAERFHAELAHSLHTGALAGLLYVGDMRRAPVGPHPQPQFEIHFMVDALPQVHAQIVAAGLKALVHPLTDDDLADHTTLATWIGEPLVLDVSVLDPPGMNKGVARFGKTDF